MEEPGWLSPQVMNEREEGRILIINYSFLVFELNRSLRNPKDD